MSTEMLTAPDRVVALTVEVVDGEGTGVAGEPVEVAYRLDDAYEIRRRTVTDGAGRADLVERLPARPETVVIAAAGETAGPTDLSQQTWFVIEA